MAKIKIVQVPSGQAPLWVRQEWVGMELPVAENLPNDTVEMGVLGGKPEDADGYPVETVVAFRELKKKNPAAAQWWETYVPASLLPWLSFQRGVCVYEPNN